MKVSVRKAEVILVTIFSYLFYAFLINTSISNYQFAIAFMSILGWIVWAFICITWKKTTKQLFSLYIIFVSFAVLFTYGQCLMWALGIHNESEIINRVIFGRIRFDDSDIFKTQLFTLIGLLSFHTGAICFYKPTIKTSSSIKQKQYCSSLSSVCRVTLIFSSLCVYYYWIRNVIVYRSFGYGAYQYGDTSGNISSIIVIVGWLFVPSIIGVLVSSQYKKSYQYICYCLFSLYVILCILAGDRGWIYELAILVWLHLRMQNEINIHRIIKLGVLGVLTVVFCEAISKVRQSKLSLSAIMHSIYVDSPFTSAFFEMGVTMAPTAVIIHDPSFHYPYGNTYFAALFEMITTKLITFFFPNYQGIGGWFSQTYLGLSYGAGFSIIAEALANFGLYFAPLWLVIMGALICRMITIHPDEHNELIIFFKSTTCMALLLLVRNTTVNALKRWFFTTVVILLVVIVLSKIQKEKN